jgi:hypothetical protein
MEQVRGTHSLLHSHAAGERNTPVYSIVMEQVRGTPPAYSIIMEEVRGTPPAYSIIMEQMRATHQPTP